MCTRWASIQPLIGRATRARVAEKEPSDEARTLISPHYEPRILRSDDAILQTCTFVCKFGRPRSAEVGVVVVECVRYPIYPLPVAPLISRFADSAVLLKRRPKTLPQLPRGSVYIIYESIQRLEA